MNKFRARLFEIIQIGNDKDTPSRAFDIGITLVIVVNILVAFLMTFDSLDSYRNVFYIIEFATTIIFTIEYILRLLTADYLYPKKSKAMAVLSFVLSFYGLVDFLSFFPFYLPFVSLTGMAVFRLIRVIRIFRLFRINTQFDAFSVIVNVITQKKKQLMSSVVLILMIMMAASLLMYGVEHEAQPEIFKNALSGFWWSMATIFTIGYGDIYPITPVGKIMALVISFLGVGMVAIPTGIISAGFVEQFAKIDRYRGHEHGRELQYMTGLVNKQHKWLGKTVGEIELPPQSKLVLVVRAGKMLLPYDEMVMEVGDVTVVVSNNQLDDDISLNEIIMTDNDKWVGKTIEDIELTPNEIVVMIKRNGEIFVPNDKTVIGAKDCLIVYSAD